MDPQFLPLLTSECTYSQYDSTDTFGNNVYAVGVLFKARIDRRFNRKGGGEINAQRPNHPSADYTLICEVIDGMTVRNKVTLPTGEVTYVRDVDIVYDENGPHHMVISVSTEDES